MLYMFLAEGFEETEAIGCLDIIRRAGIDIKTVSVCDEKEVRGSHGILVVSDLNKSEITTENVDGVILPGGMPGTLNLEKDETVSKFISYCSENNKMLAAICAAPMIFGKKGLLNEKSATCYPGFEEYLAGCEYKDEHVVRCDNFITGKGAGAAMLFGAAIADYFINGKGEELLKEVHHK